MVLLKSGLSACTVSPCVFSCHSNRETEGQAPSAQSGRTQKQAKCQLRWNLRLLSRTQSSLRSAATPASPPWGASGGGTRVSSGGKWSEADRTTEQSRLPDESLESPPPPASALAD